ncbi:RloB family protein [Sphingopyxis sp. R3-92]|uniref:RloB family protein n=1 Tax=Sphingopyxis sp. R3-92 TaxID=3158553 RepID=UPI003EE604E8
MRQRKSLRRAAPKRAPKAKFIIYSEGKNTEPDYFKAVRRDLLGALVDLEVIDAAGVPITIAEKACERATAMKRARGRRSSFEEADQIWAVFDRDEHPKVPEAIERCRASSVEVAFSDPCFELWLLLHFDNFDRPDDRHQVQAALAKVCKDYDPKGKKSADFGQFLSKVEDAENRAQQQLARREDEGIPPRRPFTTVFNLTQEMRKAHLAYKGSDAV